jgi:methyl-accepting chemotaxis protein
VRSLAESSARSVNAVDGLMREMEAKVNRGLELSSHTKEHFSSIAEGIRQSSLAALELARGMETRREETLSVLPELDQLAERLCALQEQYADRRSAREGIETSLGEIRALSEDIREAERRLVEQDYVILAMLEDARAAVAHGGKESPA